MDGQRFDELTRALGFSLNRKRFVALVGGFLGAGSAVRAPDGAVAKRGGRKRNRRKGGVGAQGDSGVCDALCSGSGPDPRFCGSFGNCGSDDDCILQDPARPICCTTGSCGGAGEGACCSAPICGGFCEKDADCPDVADCVCDESDNRCVSVTCGGACAKDADCQGSPGCSCLLPSEREIEGEGELIGECVTEACGGSCTEDADCASGGLECICDESAGQCVTITCAGSCFKDADCPDLENCSCTINVPPSRVGAEGNISGSCVSQACPGDCSSNPDCREQGQENCVCFLGNDVRVSAAIVAEGSPPVGACGACLGAGGSCDASTECCGQLVCQSGRCQRKRKPKKKERCAKHGHNCTQDEGCCAQAICYRGECGEKDTHCDSDNECARGYSCVGGRLTGSHRRCRRNKRNKPHRRRNRG